MSFIDYRDPPRDISNYVEVANESIIGCHKHIELEVVRRMRTIFIIPLIFAEHISPNTLSIMVDATLHVGPAFEFTTPVLNCTQGNLP
jgi:hypothetical protein